MVPPPKPSAWSLDTVVWATANGPRTASMLDSVGSGPRSYGFSWAPAGAAPMTVEPATITPARSAPSRVRTRAMDVDMCRIPPLSVAPRRTRPPAPPGAVGGRPLGSLVERELQPDRRDSQ